MEPRSAVRAGVAVGAAGSTVGRRRLTGCVSLVLVGGRRGDRLLLLHTPRPLVEASIEMAEQLPPVGGSCRRIVEAA